VRVVEVLHGLRAQVDAQVLQVGMWRGLLEAEHVQDADEAIGGMTHSIVKGRHRLGARIATANGGGMLGGSIRLVVHRFIGVRAEGAQRGAQALQAVGPTHNGGHRAAVERLGQAVARHVGIAIAAHGLDQLATDVVRPGGQSTEERSRRNAQQAGHRVQLRLPLHVHLEAL